MMVEIAVIAKITPTIYEVLVHADTLLRAFYVLSHLIFLAIPCGRLCYHHFKDKETGS